jgi:mannosyltransferase OCH1-like enzyme
MLDLVNTQAEIKCPDGLFLVKDNVSDNSSKKRIPQTVHVTSRSRCVTREFYDNLQKWKLDGHSFFLHNDGAMDRLLQRHWPEFPHLQMVMRCHVSEAVKADLWRALVLWEYGGIYTDIDNAPTDEFKARNYIGEEDQAFFLIKDGFLSQHFYAAEPRHPMTYMIVHHTLLRLLRLINASNQYVPFVTGPGDIKIAFLHFMSDQGIHNEPGEKENKHLFDEIKEAGVYTGMDNWTVTVLGTASRSDQYVARSIIPPNDRLDKLMNITTHFDQIPMNMNDGSCLQRIYYNDPLAHSETSIDQSNSIGVPILDLVNTQAETKCPDGLFLVKDSVSNNTSNKRIPQTVHVTSRSRCVTREFYDNLQAWKLPGHSFFLHNDGAMDRLLQRYWPQFPHLQKVLLCLVSGAAKADLWRALVLWEYGGIYTDIDNSPTDEFRARNYIGEEDQAFFVIERGAFLSQYFYAAEPRHPMTYMIVHHTLLRLLGLNNVLNQYVPFVTGPGAVKSAFIGFMSDWDTGRFGKVRQPGVYTGMGNTTVTVLGTARNSGQYVARGVVPNKGRLYDKMNMTHFSVSGQKPMNKKNARDHEPKTDSCLQHIYFNDP